MSPTLHWGVSGAFPEMVCEAGGEFRCLEPLIKQYGSSSLPRVWVHPGVGIGWSISAFLSVFATHIPCFPCNFISYFSSAVLRMLLSLLLPHAELAPTLCSQEIPLHRQLLVS